MATKGGRRPSTCGTVTQGNKEVRQTEAAYLRLSSLLSASRNSFSARLPARCHLRLISVPSDLHAHRLALAPQLPTPLVWASSSLAGDNVETRHWHEQYLINGYAALQGCLTRPSRERPLLICGTAALRVPAAQALEGFRSACRRLFHHAHSALWANWSGRGFEHRNKLSGESEPG